MRFHGQRPHDQRWPFGQITYHDCTTNKPPYLSRPRAVQALWRVFLEAHPAGFPLELGQVIGVQRTSSGEFAARGVWVRSLAAGGVEGCGSELAVRLGEETGLVVELGEPECKVTVFVE